jgi:hypothetical protein
MCLSSTAICAAFWPRWKNSTRFRPTLAVPGHGRALTWPGALAPEQRYLSRLLADVTTAIKAKRTLAETLALLPGEGGQWLLFDQFHRRNVTAAYAELEWDD